MDSQANSFSDLDIKHFLPKAKVLKYSEFVRSGKTIKQLMGKQEHPIVLLFELKQSSGHWTCLSRLPDGTLSFFDSYGFKPDDELKFVPDHFKKQSKQDHTYLINKMLEDGAPVEYQPYKLQKMSKDICSCGRHVIARLAFSNLPIEQYVDLYRTGSKRYGNGFMDVDSIVTEAIPKVDWE